MSDYVTGFYTKDGIKKYDYNALANLPSSAAATTILLAKKMGSSPAAIARAK